MNILFCPKLDRCDQEEQGGGNILAKGLSVAIQVFAGVQSVLGCVCVFFFKEENLSSVKIKGTAHLFLITVKVREEFSKREGRERAF